MHPPHRPAGRREAPLALTEVTGGRVRPERAVGPWGLRLPRPVAVCASSRAAASLRDRASASGSESSGRRREGDPPRARGALVGGGLPFARSYGSQASGSTAGAICSTGCESGERKNILATRRGRSKMCWTDDASTAPLSVCLQGPIAKQLSAVRAASDIAVRTEASETGTGEKPAQQSESSWICGAQQQGQRCCSCACSTLRSSRRARGEVVNRIRSPEALLVSAPTQARVVCTSARLTVKPARIASIVRPSGCIFIACGSRERKGKEGKEGQLTSQASVEHRREAAERAAAGQLSTAQGRSVLRLVRERKLLLARLRLGQCPG
ncbi:hypothetical protein AAT19DRAFT_12456 [Rhodotorula toruloides]|uniref:Uncharacterized protein n=1 Tax=Rhodotorula toruloides TaxID=5286 RepID=A0A2T0AGA2_RHOTO|nr:hypothetical protein AAT19DRAFT_12456 [Rhodotorula toruloides]